MNSPARELQRAKAVKRGIAGLLLFGGALRIFFWTELRSGIAGLLTGLAFIALGAGVLLHWRGARALVLGVCYLAIVAACALPALFVEFRPFASFEGETIIYLLCSAFGATFAFIGYQGLQYFRSQLARGEYARDPGALAELEMEGSGTVVVSALVCLSFLVPLAALELHDAQPKPALSGAKVATTRSAAKSLPDLLITGLCQVSEGPVKAIVENHGTASSNRQYRIQYTNLRFRAAQDFSMGIIPEPGKHGLVTLDRAIDHAAGSFSFLTIDLDIDADRKIEESNEANNSARFVIEFRDGRTSNLDNCKSAAIPKGTTSLDPNRT